MENNEIPNDETLEEESLFLTEPPERLRQYRGAYKLTTLLIGDKWNLDDDEKKQYEVMAGKLRGLKDNEEELKGLTQDLNQAVDNIGDTHQREALRLKFNLNLSAEGPLPNEEISNRLRIRKTEIRRVIARGLLRLTEASRNQPVHGFSPAQKPLSLE